MRQESLECDQEKSARIVHGSCNIMTTTRRNILLDLNRGNVFKSHLINLALKRKMVSTIFIQLK